MDGWNTSFLLEWPIFRGYVSFREGNGQLLVWGPVVWIFGIPENERDYGTWVYPRIPNHRAPKQQLTFSWSTSSKKNNLWWQFPSRPREKKELEDLRGCLGGGFKYVLLSPLFGEDSHFDEHIFQMGWNHQLVVKLEIARKNPGIKVSASGTSSNILTFTSLALTSARGESQVFFRFSNPGIARDTRFAGCFQSREVRTNWI